MPAKLQTTLRFTEEFKQRLEKESAALGQNMTEYIVESCEMRWKGKQAAPRPSAAISPRAAEVLDFLETGHPELVRSVEAWISNHKKSRAVGQARKVQ